jgi:hypothetical protein
VSRLVHRVVAEVLLGRRLLTTEEVHHKNGRTWDNRPANLVLLTRCRHVRLTWEARPVGRKCVTCGGWFLRIRTRPGGPSRRREGLSCTRKCAGHLAWRTRRQKG